MLFNSRIPHSRHSPFNFIIERFKQMSNVFQCFMLSFFYRFYLASSSSSRTTTLYISSSILVTKNLVDLILARTVATAAQKMTFLPTVLCLLQESMVITVGICYFIATHPYLPHPICQMQVQKLSNTLLSLSETDGDNLQVVRALLLQDASALRRSIRAERG